MLFSATTTKKTEDLVKLALKKEPIYVGLEEKASEASATVTGLEQVLIPRLAKIKSPHLSNNQFETLGLRHLSV